MNNTLTYLSRCALTACSGCRRWDPYADPMRYNVAETRALDEAGLIPHCPDNCGSWLANNGTCPNDNPNDRDEPTLGRAEADKPKN